MQREQARIDARLLQNLLEPSIGFLNRVIRTSARCGRRDGQEERAETEVPERRDEIMTATEIE